MWRWNIKLISIITPCLNEEDNVEQLHAEITQVMSELPEYDFEHIYIDNASTDQTIPLLKRLAATDKRVKVILNTRNFSQTSSSVHGLLQAQGDAAILMASDLQDPPYLIGEFIKKWESGYKVVAAVKPHSEEPKLNFALRTLAYRILGKMANVRLIHNFYGFGLYDRQIIEIMRKIDDPYPFIRGLIADIGFDAAIVEFVQPARQRGKTKANFYTLFDIAMLGLTSSTKIPLRVATIFGFFSACISLLVGLFYFIYKLIEWQSFELGLAPLVVGLFFFGSIQLFSIGIVGEYIGAIYTLVLHRPLVIEKERINFDTEDH